MSEVRQGSKTPASKRNTSRTLSHLPPSTTKCWESYHLDGKSKFKKHWATLCFRMSGTEMVIQYILLSFRSFVSNPLSLHSMNPSRSMRHAGFLKLNHPSTSLYVISDYYIQYPTPSFPQSGFFQIYIIYLIHYHKL